MTCGTLPAENLGGVHTSVTVSMSPWSIIVEVLNVVSALSRVEFAVQQEECPKRIVMKMN